MIFYPENDFYGMNLLDSFQSQQIFVLKNIQYLWAGENLQL